MSAKQSAEASWLDRVLGRGHSSPQELDEYKSETEKTRANAAIVKGMLERMDRHGMPRGSVTDGTGT